MDTFIFFYIHAHYYRLVKHLATYATTDRRYGSYSVNLFSGSNIFSPFGNDFVFDDPQFIDPISD